MYNYVKLNHTVGHQMIHYIKFSRFLPGRTNSRKIKVVKLDRGESPYFSSAISQVDSFSGCGEKCLSQSSSLWTSKIGKIMKQLYCFFMNREGEK